MRQRNAHYDAAFVSDDGAFRHAHITVLAPLHDWDLDGLASLAAETASFGFRLSRIRVFPNGIIYLSPEPDAPFRRLTRRARELLPEVVPFGAPDPTPHLTLDAIGPGVTVDSTRRSVEPLLPVEAVADRLELVWYEAHRCHTLHSWSLGSPG